MKLSYDKTEFLNSVIDYCSTNDRAKYLKELAARGLFTVVDPKKLLEEYLEDTEICQPGKKRALEHFGFTPKPKTGVTRYVIDVEYEISPDCKYYGAEEGSKDSGTVWGGFGVIEDALLSKGMIRIGTGDNKVIKVTMPDFRTNVVPQKVNRFDRNILATTELKGRLS